MAPWVLYQGAFNWRKPFKKTCGRSHYLFQLPFYWAKVLSRGCPISPFMQNH